MTRHPKGRKNTGIIGVGEIGKAIVEGLCGVADTPPRIHLSPRGIRTSAGLAERYENVRVTAGNQEVIDRSEVVIVAVRPQDRFQALSGLEVSSDKVVVHVMAGVAIEEVRRALDTEAPVVRAIPLPAVRERRSMTVAYPSHPDADSLFESLGGTIPARSEDEVNVYSALTATFTTHYRYLSTITSWANGYGIAPEDADRYVRALFQGVGRALGDETRSLHQLASDHETPGGINEQIRTAWLEPANTQALTKALDTLLDRLISR